jgi:hypothetical protein
VKRLVTRASSSYPDANVHLLPQVDRSLDPDRRPELGLAERSGHDLTELQIELLPRDLFLGASLTIQNDDPRLVAGSPLRGTLRSTANCALQSLTARGVR